MVRRLGWWVTVLLVAALAGCTFLFPPDVPEPPDPDEDPAVANVEPADAASDAFPLFPGARWVYRNATPDLIPVLHPGAMIESDVVATVRCRDAAGTLFECFVLRTREGTERETIAYLHRAEDGARLHAVEVRASGALPRAEAFAGELFLRQPFVAGDSWSFGQLAGMYLSSRVAGQETVPLRDTIHTLLGPYTNSFTGAWRVRSTYTGILADAFGSGIVETWHAPGVGMVKRTAGSLFYELVEFREYDEVLALDAASPEGPYRPPVDAVVMVELRGSSPLAREPGVIWDLEGETDVAADGILAPLSGGYGGAFVSDLDGVVPVDTGTYVFSFKVRASGATTLRFVGRVAGEAAPAKTARFSFAVP